MWFTEDALPPVILFIMIGLVLAFVANAQQKPRLYGAAGFMLILAGITVFLERAVVTDAEKIESAIYDLAEAFHENDLAGTLNHFSPQNIDLQGQVGLAVAAVDIEDDYRITDLDIRTSADKTLAQSHLRVNVTATVLGLANDVRRPTRWNLKWRKEGDKWRIIEVHQLDPINGREVSQWRQVIK